MGRPVARLFPEPTRKRTAAALVGRNADLLSALGGNAQLHRWLEENRPFPYFPHRYALYAEIQERTLGDEPIDYLEFGLREGHSIFKWAEINRHRESRFTGFDSFEGLPEDWVSVTGTAREGSFSAGGVAPACTDPRVRFVKGWFRDTLPLLMREFTPRSQLVVHCDADLYSSTLFVLCTLDAALQRGSILIFDEFANPVHEWRAFRDYSFAFGRSFRVLGAAAEYYTQMAMEFT